VREDAEAGSLPTQVGRIDLRGEQPDRDPQACCKGADVHAEAGDDQHPHGAGLIGQEIEPAEEEQCGRKRGDADQHERPPPDPIDQDEGESCEQDIDDADSDRAEDRGSRSGSRSAPRRSEIPPRQVHQERTALR